MKQSYLDFCKETGSQLSNLLQGLISPNNETELNIAQNYYKWLEEKYEGYPRWIPIDEYFDKYHSKRTKWLHTKNHGVLEGYCIYHQKDPRFIIVLKNHHSWIRPKEVTHVILELSKPDRP